MTDLIPPPNLAMPFESYIIIVVLVEVLKNDIRRPFLYAIREKHDHLVAATSRIHFIHLRLNFPTSKIRNYLYELRETLVQSRRQRRLVFLFDLV